MAELMDALGDPMADHIVHPDPALTAKVAKLSVFDALDTWLKYNGIIGYTAQILATVDALRSAAAAHDAVSDDDHPV